LNLIVDKTEHAMEILFDFYRYSNCFFALIHQYCVEVRESLGFSLGWGILDVFLPKIDDLFLDEFQVILDGF
jgi:hypothetical protein